MLRLLLVPALLAALLALGCSTVSHEPVAIKASVETFYSGIANDNADDVSMYLSPAASPSFRKHVQQVTAAAQTSQQVLKSVQIAKISDPVINGDSALVHVVFANGNGDEVSLLRSGLMWLVVKSGRLA